MRRKGFLLKGAFCFLLKGAFRFLLKGAFCFLLKGAFCFLLKGAFSEKEIVVLSEKIREIILFLALVRCTPNLRRSA